jgi:hypothetical protein
MSYYVRVLTPEKRPISADGVRAGLAELGREDVTLVVDETEDEADWTAIVAYTKDGEPIGLLTRDARADADSLAKEELEDFQEELAEALPKSGAAWVRQYLKQVETIYAVQLMAKAFEEEGAGVPGLVLEAIRAEVGGIIQADGEGFSNESGAQIVWQYDDEIDGTWTAAVLVPDKTWLTFEMDRADPAHRAAFQEGRVPEGVAAQADE